MCHAQCSGSVGLQTQPLMCSRCQKEELKFLFISQDLFIWWPCETLPYETPQYWFDLRRASQFQKFLNSDSGMTQHARRLESRYGVLRSRGFIKVPGIFGDQNFSKKRSAIKGNLEGAWGKKGAQRQDSASPLCGGVVCN